MCERHARQLRSSSSIAKNRITSDFMTGRTGETARRIAHAYLVILAACFALAGCGGGGGGSGGGDNAPGGGSSAPSAPSGEAPATNPPPSGSSPDPTPPTTT